LRERRARTLLIGPLPPPVTGQSVAFELLARELGKIRPVQTVDLSELAGRRDQKFSLSRAMQMVRLAASMFGNMRAVSVVYITIAQSRLGFIRDALFISIARAWRRPVIAHLHGGNYARYYNTEPPLMRILIRTTLLRLDRLIVLSDRLRSDFDFLGPVFAPRLRAVPNASPIPSGSPRQAPRGELRLLYLSNLLVEKGYLDCIDALPHLMRLLPDFRIKLSLAGRYLLGQDEYETIEEMEATLRKHVRYLGVEDAVEITGVVEGKAKQALIAAAHIHLLPTYYQNEGQPITIIEALSAGLPSVTTPWRGIVDLVEDGRTGFLVPPRDPLAVAEAVARLCADPALYERMSAAAIEAAGRFSQRRYVGEIAKLIDEAVASGPYAARA
jgi:glycosyltransferase involved in cell wall biosynthesis